MRRYFFLVCQTVLIVFFTTVASILLGFFFNWCFNNLIFCLDPDHLRRLNECKPNAEALKILQDIKPTEPTLKILINRGLKNSDPDAGWREFKQIITMFWDFYTKPPKLSPNDLKMNPKSVEIVQPAIDKYLAEEKYKTKTYRWFERYGIDYFFPEQFKWKHLPFDNSKEFKRGLFEKLLNVTTPTCDKTIKNSIEQNSESVRLRYGLFYCFFFFILVTFFNFLFCNYLGFNGVYLLTIFALLGLFFSSFVLTLSTPNVSYLLNINIYPFYTNNNFFCVSFGVDKITSIFVVLVTAIALSSVLYSKVYLTGDPYNDDFLIKLSWFIISMISVVLSRNIICLYLSWEFIGITSAWLINFYSHRTETTKSALKAFTFNKISDLALLAFAVIAVHMYGTTAILAWSSQTSHGLATAQVNSTEMQLCAFFLILAACIKSAQLGFHIWLPDSMDAPVPASALIHSATLVSAGVYLLLRFDFLILASGFKPIVCVIGAITAAYGGVVAAAQTNIKRALAYSTISHCGFLFVATTLGDVNVVLLYLCLHGFFKALSFLCAGEIIKTYGSYQDVNKMGGCYYKSPAIAAQFFVAMCNLSGFPLFFGYTFKNKLQAIAINHGLLHQTVVVCLIIGFVCSLFYFVNLVINTTTSYQKNNYKVSLEHVQEGLLLSSQPIKSPKILYIIFWIVYLSSVCVVFVYGQLDVISYLTPSEFISTTATHSTATAKKQLLNFFFFFYTCFFWTTTSFFFYSPKTIKNNHSPLVRLFLLFFFGVLLFFVC